MYGTRDAPVEWQRVVQGIIQEIGFAMSKVVLCLYAHERNGVRMTVHVDDFLCTGGRMGVNWVEQELKRRFELTAETLGGATGESKKVSFLFNFTIRDDAVCIGTPIIEERREGNEGNEERGLTHTVSRAN